MNQEKIFFHGSHVLFDHFDLDGFALSGDGKVKFGYGVYVTSKFNSAAHYSGANPDAAEHFVYTLEVPCRKEDNYISYKQPVHASIISRAEAVLGETVPEKFTLDGKDFRKYLATRLTGNKKVDVAGEKAARDFLLGIGVDFIEWPYNWKNPDLGTNRAVLDDRKVRILKVEKVELDDRKKFVEGSNVEVI